jgi:tryptophan synthase beta chain
VIAETGAGQHGVATATMAARFGFDCTIYMGEVDVERQRPNVFWMEQLGATVVPVTDGTRIFKDAINEAFRDWVTNMDTTHYVLGTACGPHPFPEMVTWFPVHRRQGGPPPVWSRRAPARPGLCLRGGGSNAMGVFSGFLDDPVELVGVEAAGRGLDSGEHASRLCSSDASIGVAQGYKTYFLQDDDGQMQRDPLHRRRPGLCRGFTDPGGSQGAGRVRFEGGHGQGGGRSPLRLTMKPEGLIPALESAHAFARAFKEAPQMSPDEIILINQSGRGDKDIFTIAEAFDDPKWKQFIIEKAKQYHA